MARTGEYSAWRYYGVAALLWAVLYALLTALVLSYEARRLEKDFLRNTADIQHSVSQRMDACRGALDGLSFALTARGVPDLAFERYARHVLVQHEQILRIVTVRHVPANRLEVFLRRMRTRHGQRYALRSFAFDGARSWRPAPPAKSYYPITFVVPHRPRDRALLGLDLGTVGFLLQPLRQTLATGEAVASSPFRLLDGSVGYALFQSAAEDGNSAVALSVRAAALLPPRTDGYALRAVLRHGGEKTPEIVLREGRRIGPLARLLLPRFHDHTPLGEGRSRFVLATTKQMDWGDFSPAPMVPMLALSLLGLPAALGIAHQRRIWDRAMQRYQRDLAFRATHDVLTGLPNRALFEDRFAHARALAQRTAEKFALVFVDLDNFKSLNDRHGHEAGDAVLRETAQRLSAALRRGDTVARIGGDEFLVLLEGLNSRRAARDAARHIVRALRLPVAYHQLHLHVGASVGVALFPDDGSEFASLSAAADAAMYHEKRSRGRRPSTAPG